MAYQTVLKINEKSWSNGDTWHVGQKGIDATITWQPGWILKQEIITDKNGYPGLHIYFEKPDDLQQEQKRN